MAIKTNDARGAETTSRHIVLKMLVVSIALAAIALAVAAQFF